MRLYVYLAVLLCAFLFSATAYAAPILVKEGVRGEAVRVVQQLLIEQKFLEGAPDGICGPKTVAAIRKFQETNGLEVDGICGNATYRALNHGKDYEPSPKAIQEEKEALARKEAEARASEATGEHYRAKGRLVYVNATAYSAYDPGNGSHTAMGTLLRKGIIAVDPNFIALGTRVWIPGYGEAVAEDVGWGIKGNRIDIAFDSHEEAIQFGRQSLEIYVMD